MGKRDPRVDAYIAKQRDFAKPILKLLRDAIHEGCPGVEETLKWRAPSFTYHGILCGAAGFKEHATFGFWKHSLLFGKREDGAWGTFGRLTSVADLPARAKLVAMVRKAAALNESGAKTPRRAPAPKKPIPMHPALRAALAKNKAAKANFEGFSPSQKREYLLWISEAKADDTRARRVEQAVAWMAEGKTRNWKYM